MVQHLKQSELLHPESCQHVPDLLEKCSFSSSGFSAPVLSCRRDGIQFLGGQMGPEDLHV